MARDRGWLQNVPWVLAPIYVLGGGALMIANARHWPMVVKPHVTAWIMTAVMSVVVAVGHALWCRRHTSEEVPFKFNLLFGLLASVLLIIPGSGWFAAMNAWLDGSGARPHRTRVVRQWHQSRGGNYVEVESWRERGESIELHAPDDVYDAKPAFVIVTTRGGAFGAEWVVDVDVDTR